MTGLRKFLGLSTMASIAAVSGMAFAAGQLTQRDGVYTVAQADRGKVAYDGVCAGCHGANLKGVTNASALVGTGFERKWEALTLGDLSERIHSTMPLSRPGSLTSAQTSDIVAYILSANGYKAGSSQLPVRSDDLEAISFVASGGGGQAQASVSESAAADKGEAAPKEQIARRPPQFPDDRGDAMEFTANLGPGPWEFDTLDYRIKVTKITGDLNHPWGLVWMPNGDMLVTERSGQLRIIHDGVLDPTPVSGMPKVLVRDLDGLFDIALHPQFAKNHLVYFTYSKPNQNMEGTSALGRGRLEGHELKDVEDLYVAGPTSARRSLQAGMSRILFAPDGKIFMTTSDTVQDRLQAQDPSGGRGKILRLNDDGTPAPHNPFVGKSDFGIPYLPEIWSLGHRTTTGLTFNPTTGQLFEAENGPQGGDEINVILPGNNYGWPLTSYGLEYDGTFMPHSREGLDEPLVYWTPAIGVGGIAFYNGDKFPKWAGNLFVCALKGEFLARVTFNDKGRPIPDTSKWNREQLLGPLNQRLRQVKQGPDGNLYVLTDYAHGGAVLRIEPVGPPSGSVH